MKLCPGLWIWIRMDPHSFSLLDPGMASATAFHELQKEIFSFVDPATNFYSSGSGSYPILLKHIWKLSLKTLNSSKEKNLPTTGICHFLFHTSVHTVHTGNSRS